MPGGLSLQVGLVYNLVMRKVVLGLGISLDGYMARLDDSVDFLFMPKDYSMGPFFRIIDAAIMGRKTCDAGLKIGGGGQLAREFLKADLIDEFYLGVVPVLLGEGLPLFPSSFPPRNLALVENRTYSKGLISLKYERLRKKAKRKS
jgi:dihydrofolate reductase